MPESTKLVGVLTADVKDKTFTTNILEITAVSQSSPWYTHLGVSGESWRTTDAC